MTRSKGYEVLRATYKFDGDGLRVEKVGPCRTAERQVNERMKFERQRTFENDAEGALTDFAANAIVDAYKICSGRCVLAHGVLEERKDQPGRQREREKKPGASKAPQTITRPNMYTA